MNDQKIIQLLHDRNEAALNLLADRFGFRLMCTAFSILGNRSDAEEIVSDTYLAVWNAIPPESPSFLSSYIYRIGRNLALKRLRSNTALKRNSFYDLSLDELAECIPGAALEDTVEAKELGRAIDRFLDTLPADNRNLFLRRYWFGDSVKDLARTFALTQNTVSVRLNRIRNQLKNYLIQEGYYE